MPLRHYAEADIIIDDIFILIFMFIDDTPLRYLLLLIHLITWYDWNTSTNEEHW
jgi:hypothetical protein